MPGSDQAVPGSSVGTPGDVSGACCLCRAGKTRQPMSSSKSSRADVPIRHAGINLLLFCILTQGIGRIADCIPAGAEHRAIAVAVSALTLDPW